MKLTPNKCTAALAVITIVKLASYVIVIEDFTG